MTMFLNKKNLLLTIFLFWILSLACAQNFQSVFPAKDYPTTQFQSPVDFPIYLAGNYGECRPGHFHSGLDIKTQQVENKKIHAIDFGFVSRIKISSTGFGNALYISHPGGYTSLYAHLNSFDPIIQSVVEYYQYTQKKWDIDIVLPYWMLIVQKGQQIALSGNTGSSLAPHLHLEIRDSKTEKTLNPWLFGFQIQDHTAPVIQSLAIYNLDEEAPFYGPGSERKIQTPKSSDGKIYTFNAPLKVASSKVGFAIQATDFIDKNSGKLGVYETQMYVDEELYFAWQKDNIGYDETRYLHAFADYALHIEKKKWYEYAFKLPGNQLNIYHDPSGKNGVVDISDGKEHRIHFKLYDVLGNLSTLDLRVVKSGHSKPSMKCSTLAKADKANELEEGSALALFDKNSFYAPTCMLLKRNGKRLEIGSKYIPVHSYFGLSVEQEIADKWQDKMTFVRVDNENTILESHPAYYRSGRLRSQEFRTLGFFEIRVDTTAPSVSIDLQDGGSLNQGQRIRIHAEDDISYVDSISLQANGRWLCLTRRKNNYSYRIDNHCPRGKVKFELYAQDANHNRLHKSYQIMVR